MTEQSNTENERYAELKQRLDEYYAELKQRADDTMRRLEVAIAAIDAHEPKEDFVNRTSEALRLESEVDRRREHYDLIQLQLADLREVMGIGMQAFSKKTGKPIVRWEEAYYTVTVTTPQRGTWEYDVPRHVVDAMPAYRGLVGAEGTVELRDEAILCYFDADGCECQEKDIELVEYKESSSLVGSLERDLTQPERDGLR